MSEYSNVLRESKIFSGIDEVEITGMLKCLDTRKKDCPRGSYILHAGESVTSIGLILSGSVLIIQEDVWGNRNIVSRVGEGETFALAVACAPGSLINSAVVAETDTKVMFLSVKRILTICSSACTCHNRLIQNLIGELAEKNMKFSEKITHMGQRTTKDKVMSYLSSEAQRRGNYAFDIPFSRQQLADFLSVDRSGLSVILSEMKKEGLIDYEKNHFILKTLQ